MVPKPPPLGDHWVAHAPPARDGIVSWLRELGHKHIHVWRLRRRSIREGDFWLISCNPRAKALYYSGCKEIREKR